ncbi:MAG: CD225/dispanin family protein [Muribaculaceae bacterium]|nr:CD225/dispanin family protein [Muribaculaceae bacterium]
MVRLEVKEPIAGNNLQRKSEEEVMPPTYLIWSILTTVFCCFIPGIVAIIFSSQVSSKFYAGDIEGARKSSRLAEIWIIVSVVLGVLTATLYLPFMLIS